MPTTSIAERREYVYKASIAVAEQFAAGVAAHLDFDPHNIQARSPEAAHYVTTLYFDSANHDIAQACATDINNNTKLRAREYFDRSVENEILTEQVLWFEVKARIGSQTRKLRFPVPSEQVGAFLSDGQITERMIELQRERWGNEAEQLFEEIGALCSRTAGPLRPDCVAHYRRRAWQDAAGRTRVTLDTELAFYRPPQDLFDGAVSLHEVVVGDPVMRADHCVIEIKLLGEMPEWLRELIAATELEPEPDSPAPRTFSKFLAASRAVARASGEDPSTP